MYPTEMKAHCMSLLIKIHMITGWSIPASELRNVLSDQLQKHLEEKYSELNVDEIEYAFRDTGTTTKDWGKTLNLSMIDEVLIPYLNKRLTVSETEAKVKGQKAITDTNYFRMINEDYERFTSRYWRRFFKASPYFPPQYYETMKEHFPMIRDYARYWFNQYRNKWPDTEKDKLIELSKDRSVLWIFRQCRKMLIEKIYEPKNPE